MMINILIKTVYFVGYITKIDKKYEGNKENEYCVVFADLNPKAKVHLLVVPKPHVKNILETDEFLMNKVLETIKEVAKEQNLESFRVINNCGKGAGQSVFHVHFHILSGDNLEE